MGLYFCKMGFRGLFKELVVLLVLCGRDGEMGISRAKPQLLPLVFLILSVFILLSSKVESVYFRFPSFRTSDSPKDFISFLGDASWSNGTIKLTLTDEQGIPYANASAGRAFYNKPILFLDNSTGTKKVASFHTSFTFVIKPPPPQYHAKQAEGLTFFIIPFGFGIPSYSGGKYFTLFNDTTALMPRMNKILAVEFDTKVNYEIMDPPYPHIGIDFKTIQSNVTQRWNDSASGLKAEATIKYNSTSQLLTVGLYYPSTGKTYPKLEQRFDFTDFPENVTVGFSATTGLGAETHNVLSWKFSSYFNNINIHAEEEESYSAAHSAV